MEMLSKIAGLNLFIKRDDQTGLAFGGNKVRKLEYLMADVLANEADCVITWAGVQSNWCRQLAAAATKVGILPVLLLFKRPGLPSDYDGNLLLDFLFGAEIHLRDLGPNRRMMELNGVRDLVDEIAAEHRREGRKPYVAPIGASLMEGSMQKPLGAIGYVNAVLELLEQAEARQIKIDSIVFATGSGSMQAGLLVGAKLFAPGLKVIGISVSEDAETMSRWVDEISRQTLDELVPEANITIRKDEIIVLPQYMGQGYGILDQNTASTMRIAARAEGIVLDPVYTGRAMMGLLDLARNGYFERGENVVFLHSGGTPAIFPYREVLMKHLSTGARASAS
jgi:D-cysteine desulfhydrase family pyridoxal phosphate-dependent enzyme